MDAMTQQNAALVDEATAAVLAASRLSASLSDSYFAILATPEKQLRAANLGQLAQAQHRLSEPHSYVSHVSLCGSPRGLAFDSD
ncbi:MAG: hypothetical protein ACI8PP_000220 [Candidatus Pseudothioglobus sp.]|jgi:hypothetical protein